MDRVTLAGSIDFAGKDVAPIILAARALIAATYEEPGCIHYIWADDVLTPHRVWVFEEWTSSETLCAHLAGPTYAEMAAHLVASGMSGASVDKYRISLKEPVYDAAGRPRGDFFTG